MITPQRIFLILMVMVALFPLPVFSSSAAFASTWAVLGLRKAIGVLMLSVVQMGLMTTGAMIEILQPILLIPAAVKTESGFCQSQSCVVGVVSSAEGQLHRIIIIEGQVGLFVAGLWAVTFGLTFLAVKKVRKSTMPLTQSRWPR